MGSGGPPAAASACAAAGGSCRLIGTSTCSCTFSSGLAPTAAPPTAITAAPLEGSSWNAAAGMMSA
eukprot:6526136-Prymnesium_polylepis.1